MPSVRSTAYGVVNQLRDPAIYEEAGETYLLYAVGGESGIAIAKVDFTPAVGCTARMTLLAARCRRSMSSTVRQACFSSKATSPDSVL